MNPFEYLLSRPFARAAAGEDTRCALCREYGYACGDDCLDDRLDRAWARGIANAKRAARERRAAWWRRRVARLIKWLRGVR